MRKRDYHKSKHSGNPLKNRELLKKRERRFFREKVILILIILRILAIIYWLFFSSFWQIKKINISGVSKVDEIQKIEKMVSNFLQQKRFIVFSQKNVFIFSSSSFKNMLKQRFDLEDAELDIKNRNHLEIKIIKKRPLAIWQEGNKYFTILNDAKIKKQIKNLQEFELPLVNRGTTTAVEIGQSYLSIDQLNFINKVYSLFNFYFKNLQIDHFEINKPESREVKLITKDNWYILFNLDLDIRDTLKKIKIILNLFCVFIIC